MKRSLVLLAAIVISAIVLTAGCSQATPAPAAPAQPAAAPAAPTQAAAPAAKINFPEKGRPLTWIIPYATGGNLDIISRQMAPLMDKTMGSSIAISNQPGASSQVGTTAIMQAKPDGYTVGLIDILASYINYSDPERKAPFNSKSFTAITALGSASGMWIVPANSPYKSVKDLVDAAKSGKKITFATTGALNPLHLSAVNVEKVAGFKFDSIVPYDQFPELLTALAGGKIDVVSASPTMVMASVKGGQARPIGFMGDKRTAAFPDVPTFIEQGYNTQVKILYGVFGPLNMPQDAATAWKDTIYKAQTDPTIKKASVDLGFDLIDNMGPPEIADYWSKAESYLAEWLALAKSQMK